MPELWEDHTEYTDWERFIDWLEEDFIPSLVAIGLGLFLLIMFFLVLITGVSVMFSR